MNGEIEKGEKDLARKTKAELIEIITAVKERIAELEQEKQAPRHCSGCIYWNEKTRWCKCLIRKTPPSFGCTAFIYDRGTPAE